MIVAPYVNEITTFVFIHNITILVLLLSTTTFVYSPLQQEQQLEFIPLGS